MTGLVLLEVSPVYLVITDDVTIGSFPAPTYTSIAFDTYPSPSMVFTESGVQGPAGPSATATSAVCSVDLIMGKPVVINRVTGKFDIANANWKPLTFVTGLIQASSLMGFTATAVEGVFTMADWTSICGTANLSLGQAYFLAIGGGLTLTPPGSPNCVVYIGKAVSSVSLLIEPALPIQL